MDEEKKLFRVAVGAEPADRTVSPLRADLRISPQLFYGQLCFVIKDPVTLRYFRLQPVEHFLVTQLDGHRTARDLLAILEQRFPENALTVQDVLRFVGMLHESHLLAGEGVAHATWLSDKAAKGRHQKRVQKITNFLFAKVPLFHPDKLLTLLDRTVSPWLITPISGFICAALFLLALTLVLSHTDRLAHLSYSFFSPQNLMVLYASFVITKIFHEFGHGLACKHHGGEVSQMGILLFLFTPSFYCDTSDAWMIPSRSARLWINAGGIVVELVIASLATLVWHFTQSDTLANQIAMNTMISCSVATILFNANPLMRYDGYYFLADYMEVPNLMNKGWDHIKYNAQKWLGLKPTEPPDGRRLKFLIAYALASGVYKWVIIFGIVLLLYGFFSHYGLGPFGVLLAAAYIFMSIMMPVVKTMQYLWKQRWDFSKRLAYVFAAGGAAIATLVVVALLPWHMTIREPLVVLSDVDKPIYVGTPGYLEKVNADIGKAVRAGDAIVTLRDPSLQTSLDQAIAKRDEEKIVATTALTNNKPSELAAAMEAVGVYEKNIAMIQKRISDLTIRAPIDGVVINDAPLKRTTGNYLAPGTKICRVVQVDRLQARMSLPQQQAALVKAGMDVRIRLWSDSDTAMHSTVSRVSSTVSDQMLHPALSAQMGGDVQVSQELDANGKPKAAGKRSTVIIELPPNQGAFLADGMTGRAEITVLKTTVFGRLWRMVLDTTTPDWHL